MGRKESNQTKSNKQTDANFWSVKLWLFYLPKPDCLLIPECPKLDEPNHDDCVESILNSELY